MSFEIGTITGREIEKNLDSEKKTLLLQVLVADDNDGQTVELQNQSGEDVEPPNGSRVFILDISDSYRIVVAVDDGIEPDPSIEQGERETYSSDGGERKAKIRWKKDGQLVINDGGDTAVKFSELQAAFDKFLSDHNDLVDLYNTLKGDVETFSTLYAPGGPAAVGLPPTFIFSAQDGSTSDADIAPAESKTVELP